MNQTRAFCAIRTIWKCTFGFWSSVMLSCRLWGGQSIHQQQLHTIVSTSCVLRAHLNYTWLGSMAPFRFTKLPWKISVFFLFGLFAAIRVKIIYRNDEEDHPGAQAEAEIHCPLICRCKCKTKWIFKYSPEYQKHLKRRCQPLWDPQMLQYD